VRDWNRFVANANGPQPRGRPLHASDEQVQEVRQHRKTGASLRAIAAMTGLSLATVRTILARKQREQGASLKLPGRTLIGSYKKRGRSATTGPFSSASIKAMIEATFLREGRRAWSAALQHSSRPMWRATPG
jgi:hypothetical protein